MLFVLGKKKKKNLYKKVYSSRYEFYFKGDSLGLTPAEDKELAVHALGGCIYLLKEYLLDQQLLAQSQFKTYVPADFSSDNPRAETKLMNNMVR